METVATLVLRDTWFEKEGDCIGVETGALAILKAGYPLVHALGDFDSVSLEEKNNILKSAYSVQVYPVQKDFSDSELAIHYCIEKGYQKIRVYGALGQRVDHQHVNLSLMFCYPQVILMDEKQSIQAYDEGVHELKKENHHKFSVFSFEKAVISLKACLYPLDHYELNALTRLTLSNEWTQTSARLTVLSGRVFVVKTQ
jgi:thiamine pyrophosphokinase